MWSVVFFLAVEIQQSNNATKASALQEATNVARQQLYRFAENPDLMRLAMTDFDDLGEMDQRRVQNMARSFWLGMQN